MACFLCFFILVDVVLVLDGRCFLPCFLNVTWGLLWGFVLLCVDFKLLCNCNCNCIGFSFYLGFCIPALFLLYFKGHHLQDISGFCISTLFLLYFKGHHLQDILGGGDGDSSSTALPPRVAPALCHSATTACIHTMRYKFQTPKSIFFNIGFFSQLNFFLSLTTNSSSCDANGTAINFLMMLLYFTRAVASA